MPTVTVPAIRSFAYAGRSVVPGELLELAPVEALALARKGLVSLARHYQTKVSVAVAEPESEPEPPRRRRYRRRDMTAED